ncbi:MAG: tyrosine--tRNA ligase [Candidatus Woesearchaeota archaeon]
MDLNERYETIKRNTEEIVTDEELRELLKTKKNPSVYLGTAITGRPHVAYFVWVIKLSDFLKAGFKVKLLLADMHGALDNTPWELLDKRYEYYSIVIPAMFKSIGADIQNFEIVKGSDFEKSESYFFDLLKMSTIVSIHDCKKAASEVVKQSDNPKLSGLIYPVMQALDEEYLKVDIQYGGADQRKIFMFARENHPKMGYKRRVEVMTPLIPGLIGEKMSASVEESKIDLMDSTETITRKLNKAYCPEGIVEGNGIMAFLRYVIMVIKQDRKENFIIERPQKWGGNASYKTYEEIEKDYIDKKIHPQDLKNSLAMEINKLVAPVRQAMAGNEKLVKEAYPISA